MLPLEGKVARFPFDTVVPALNALLSASMAYRPLAVALLDVSPWSAMSAN